MSNIVRRLANKDFIEDLIDDIFYGRNENIFVRHARRKEYERKYGNPELAALLPFLTTYIDIRDYLRNPDYSKKEKATLIREAIVMEIVLDAVRFGAVYGTYRLIKAKS